MKGMSFRSKQMSYLVDYRVPGAREAATLRCRGDRHCQPVVFVICSPAPHRQELPNKPDFLFRLGESGAAFGHESLARGERTFERLSRQAGGQLVCPFSDFSLRGHSVVILQSECRYKCRKAAQEMQDLMGAQAGS